MKVILPCAGKSSRFPEMRPKWMLTHPDGDLMVKKAIDGLKGIQNKDIIITILKEHEEKYGISNGLRENIGKDIQIIILDHPTSSQSETIYLTIKKAKINESFLVKDSDNTFEVEVPAENNYICYSDLQNYDEINPANKSYLAINNQGIIVDFVEKKIISTTFNVGGYFFKSCKKFIEIYEKLSKINLHELYLSHIVEQMIMEGEIFLGKEVKNYHDWGTLKDWQRYRQKFKVYFFDIDGVFLKNSAQYHFPLWKDAEWLKENLKTLKELSENPCIQIYFVTSRPEKYRKILEEKFKKENIKYSQLIMGCNHAKRVIVNDFSNTSVYPSCESINIPRDSEELRKYLN